MPFLHPILSSIIFAAIGLAVFVVAFVIIDRITPYRLWPEIMEKQNQALAILVGSGAIAMGIIISAAIHG